MQTDIFLPNIQHIYFNSGYKITEESEFLNPINDKLKNAQVNFEDYFGKNKEIENLTKIYSKIKVIFSNNVGKSLNANMISEVNELLTQSDLILSKLFGIESCTTQLVEGIGISSVPIGAGKLDLSKYSNLDDSTAMKEFNATIKTESGVKYKYLDGKHLILIIGVALFANQELKPEFLTSLIFHECGKSFLNYSFGYNIQAQRCVNFAEEVLDITNYILNLKSQFESLKDRTKRDIVGKSKDDLETIKASYNGDPNYSNEDIAMKTSELGFRYGFFDFYIKTFVKSIVEFIKWIPHMFEMNFKDFKKMSDKVRLNRSEELKKIKITTENESEKSTYYLACQFGILISMFTTLKSDWGFIQRLRYLNPISGKSVLNLVSDSGGIKFVASYGLASEYSEAIVIYEKLIKSKEFEKRGFAKPFNKIPLLNVITQLPWLTVSTVESIGSGEFTTRMKIRKVYKTLQKELEVSGLNPSLSSAIREQMEVIGNTYNEYIDPRSNKESGNAARAFIYFALRFLLKIQDKPKIDNITSSVTGINTWRESKDIPNMVGMSREENNSFEEILENNIISSESVNYIPGLDCEIKFEKYFDDSVYESLKNINFEAYFGKTPFVEESINYIHTIRDILKSVSGKISQAQKESIQKELKEWSDLVSKEFNVESTYIGVENVYNAYAYPMCVGSRKEVKRASNVKIQETSTGYKFTESKGISIIACIGLKLLCDSDLSDEIICAVIFHEFGHGFQQYENLSVIKAKSFEIYAAFCASIKYFIYDIAHLKIFDIVTAPLKLLCDLFTGFSFSRSRNSFEKELVENSEKTLKEIRGSKNSNVSISSVRTSGGGLWYCIQSLLSVIFRYLPIPGVSSFMLAVINDPLCLPDMILRGKYFKQKKQNENFADSFATKYGLGVDLSSFMETLYDSQFEDATKIPILRSIEQFNVCGAISMLSIIDDHPTYRMRIKNMYDTLQKELVNNKDLPQVMRENIQIELSEIEEMYSEMIDPSVNVKNKKFGLGLYMWCVNLFASMKRDSVENNPSKETIVSHAIKSFKSSSTIGEYTGIDEKTILDAILVDETLSSQGIF